MILPSLLLLVALTVPTVAHSSPVGCYASHLGSSSAHTGTVTIRLTTEKPLAPVVPKGAKLAVLITAEAQSIDKYAYWVFQDKTLDIIFNSNSLSGVEIKVSPVENGFRGIIQNFWDFAPFTSNTRPITLKRIPCTSKHKRP